MDDASLEVRSLAWAFPWIVRCDGAEMALKLEDLAFFFLGSALDEVPSLISSEERVLF